MQHKSNAGALSSRAGQGLRKTGAAVLDHAGSGIPALAPLCYERPSGSDHCSLPTFYHSVYNETC